jgi:ABC-type polysaccharide/polyol phosphate transport system ATPase subunit
MPLKAEAISKRSDVNWVLKEVSFETGPGEILGIFGLSGSGRGTLLRILAGSEKPNGGRFSLDSGIFSISQRQTAELTTPVRR